MCVSSPADRSSREELTAVNFISSTMVMLVVSLESSKSSLLALRVAILGDGSTMLQMLLCLESVGTSVHGIPGFFRSVSVVDVALGTTLARLLEDGAMVLYTLLGCKSVE